MSKPKADFFQSMDFDVIPYADIEGKWKKLGAGSFGNVYKAKYLGIDVAIKEVLPSKDYDVAKYFEREWRLMKEARHPNVVLYLGLSRAPPPDNRIFIISEFIENGNLRIYIHDKTKPFPWRLRMSFATDIARALAYLHARRCIHRDLKGENLLITANLRLKITDFGFARIAARNEEETKRLTFCGTDSYMSPEIALGEQFDLPTDIFSLGIIFCEILSRRLADDHNFKRAPPDFNLDADEVKRLASPGCPPEFITLALDCSAEDPAKRPTIIQVLERLRTIELDVLSRPSEADDAHVGSVKFLGGLGKRPSAPRIPSFGQGIHSSIHLAKKRIGETVDSGDEEDEEEEVMEAVLGLSSVTIGGGEKSSVWSEPVNEHPLGSEVNNPLLGSPSEYSTAVVREHSKGGSLAPSLSSILTIKPEQSPTVPAPPPAAGTPASEDPLADPPPQANLLQTTAANPTPVVPTDSMISIDSFYTARSDSTFSLAAATEGSTIRGSPSALLHRFTLVKPGAKRVGGAAEEPHHSSSWSPFDFFFSSSLGAKCDLCNKRLGWKAALECDDCGLRAHIKCGELAPRDCGLRPPHLPALANVSPLSKVKLNAKAAAAATTAPVNGSAR